MKLRDYKRREFFARHESKRRALQAISRNQNLSVSLRWGAQLEKSSLPRQSSLCRVNNRCIKTSRSKSVLKFYKLSRLEFRRLASKGALLGLKKPSW